MENKYFSHQVGKIKVSTGGDRNHGGPEQDPEGRTR